MIVPAVCKLAKEVTYASLGLEAGDRTGLENNYLLWSRRRRVTACQRAGTDAAGKHSKSSSPPAVSSTVLPAAARDGVSGLPWGVKRQRQR